MIDYTALLDKPMGPNDADVDTIRQYLCALLVMVWEDGECFNGKRPFGNSCWDNELFDALAANGYINEKNDDDYYDDDSEIDGREMIHQAIIHMCSPGSRG